MANEFDTHKVFPVTLGFVATNIATNTTAALTLDQGGAGWVIPTGYVGHALQLAAAMNATAAAGASIAFKVRDDGTALDNGPVVTLTSSSRTGSAVQALGAEPMAAGSVVSVQVTANTSGAATEDADVVLNVGLTPA